MSSAHSKSPLCNRPLLHTRSCFIGKEPPSKIGVMVLLLLKAFITYCLRKTAIFGVERCCTSLTHSQAASSADSGGGAVCGRWSLVLLGGSAGGNRWSVARASPQRRCCRKFSCRTHITTLTSLYSIMVLLVDAYGITRAHAPWQDASSEVASSGIVLYTRNSRDVADSSVSEIRK